MPDVDPGQLGRGQIVRDQGGRGQIVRDQGGRDQGGRGRATSAGSPAGHRVTVIGLLGDDLTRLQPEALSALCEAHSVAAPARQLDVVGTARQLDVVGTARQLDVVGTARQLDVVGTARQLDLAADRYPDAREPPPATGPAPGSYPDRQELITLGPDLRVAVASIASARQHGPVAVIASGDPGFFGILRLLREQIPPESLAVLPSPSAVSVAFARLALPWDDAVVVSAHGRPLSRAMDSLELALATSGKAAVLCSPDSPPEVIAQHLLQPKAGGSPEPKDRPDITHVGEEGFRNAAVVSAIGTAAERIFTGSLAEVSSGIFDPCSVLVLWSEEPPGTAGNPSLSWGLPDYSYAHRGGMITHAEVRAVVLSKLRLAEKGVVWDVGAGSGSVAVECARLAPMSHVYAIDGDPGSASRISQNARRHGVTVTVIEEMAPAALERLPRPTSVFVGGGGTGLLEYVMDHVPSGARVVATYAGLGRAATAAERLANMVSVQIAAGKRLPGGDWRLAAQNPVFLCWGDT